jgi:hypothetical protein
MDKAKGLIVAIVMFFVLPAILYMTGFFQDFIETEVGSSLGRLPTFITSSWLFIVIGLFIIALFIKLRNKGE